MQKRTKKTAKVGDEVIILETAWLEDSRLFKGHVGTLYSLETEREWAVVATPDMIGIAVKQYIKATELNKALS